LIVVSIEDDEGVRVSLVSLLSACSFEVETFSSANEFLAKRKPGASYCIILDVAMPGMTGLELQQHLNAEGDRSPVVFLTANDDPPTRDMTLKSGALGFLSKPPHPNEIIELVELAERMTESKLPGQEPAS
jgi:FixJ family two-component response regulator